jgi:DNA-binding transcriptional LysR family regulator
VKIPFALQDLQRLMPFVHAVKSGSFVAAASQLDVTPPAISKSVKRLEEELGVRLFNRTTRRLQRTPGGRDFYEQVSRALGEIEQAVAIVKEAANEPKGLVRVWVTATFGRYGLVPALSRFFELHPLVQLDVRFDESPPDIVTAGFDVRIQHGRGQGLSQVSRLLCHYPLVLVASPDYLARRGTPREPADLAQHDSISVHTGANASLTLVPTHPRKKGSAAAERFTYVPQGRLRIDGQRDASLMAALYGVGIAPSAELVVQPYLKSGRLVHVLPGWQLHNSAAGANSIYIQVPHGRHMPAKVRVFLDFLYEHFSEKGKSEERVA